MRIPSRANLFQVVGQELRHPGMVNKVDGFDLASQASFAYHLRLTSDALVPVSAHREQNQLVEPSAGISQQFENDLLTTREVPALHHGIKNRVHASPNICQLLAQIRFPLPRLRVADESSRQASRAFVGLSTNTCMTRCPSIDDGLLMQAFQVHERFRGEGMRKGIQPFIPHDEVEIT